MKLIDNIDQSNTLLKGRLSLNILLSDKSEVDDGVLKETKLNIIDDQYYNSVYYTHLPRKIMYHKLTCIKQCL